MTPNKYSPYFKIFTLLFAAFLFNYLYTLNFDEGAVLAGAWDIFNGKTIYNDFFEITPPGAFYLVFGVWKIFGASYASARIVSILFLFFGACGLFLIIKNIFKGKYPLLFSLVFILMFAYSPLISYHIYSLVLIIWSVYFFLIGLRKLKNYFFILSGVLLGCSMLFLHHRGLTALFGLSAYLVFVYLRKYYNKRFLVNHNKRGQDIKFYKKPEIKRIFLFIASALIPPITLLFFWPFDVLFEHLIIFPFFNYTEVTNVPYYFLLFYFVMFILSASLLFKKFRDTVIFLSFLQLSLFISVLPTADNIHIFYIIFPFYCLLSLLIYSRSKPARSLFERIMSLPIVIIMIIFFLYPGTRAFVNYPALPLHRPHTDDSAIAYASQACNKYEYIYAGPFIPNYYFVLNKKNPTPYPCLITNHHTDEQFAEAAEILKIKRPGCALLNYDAAVKRYDYSLNNPVDDFIKDNYTLEKRFKHFSLYIIKENQK